MTGKITEVRVQKQALLSRLEENREQHLKEFNEALVGWKVQARGAMERMIKELEETGNYAWRLSEYPRPVSHQKDYDRVISMLSAGLDEEILLTHQEFQQYWEDDWDWQQTAKALHTNYTNRR